jgi:hypothetical protein
MINTFDNFVDFTKIPNREKLSQDAKNILYRPQKMKTLSECYHRIAVLLRSNAMRKKNRKT